MGKFGTGMTSMNFPAPLFSILGEISTSAVVEWGTRIIALVTVWIIVVVLVRYLSRWIQRLDERSERIDIRKRDLRTMDRLLDYFIIFVGIIVSLAIMGWTNLLISTLTAAGVFTIIAGFAVKDVAANFISGIFILFDQPFAPGDFVQLGDHSGTVKNISLRSTTLVTLDGPVVYIPNSVVAVAPSINYSLAEDRRINFTISVANDADVGRALKIIEQVLKDEEAVLAERTQLALVNAVREYAVDIAVICYAPKDIFFTLESDLKQRVITALQENDIELAVPVRKYVPTDIPLT
jgi:small conductance mechanosensitive channel